jgi:2-iminobutanoate/2-iminopropanoate deaminase
MVLSVVNPPTVHPTTGYSHAVRMGDLIFVSGQVAMTPEGDIVGKGDVRAQTEQVFANLRAVLEAAGSGLDRVGKITVLAVRLEDRPAIGEIRNRIFAPFGYLPASTFAVVASLANPDWLVEIEAVAGCK